MKNKKKQDIILAVVCLLLGAVILLLVPQQVRVVSTGARGAVTARTFPYMAGGLMVLSSAGLLLKALLHKTHAADETAESAVSVEETEKKKSLLRTGLVFVLMILYVIAMNFIGFILASIIFGMIFLYITGIRKWWQYLIFAVLMFPLFALFKYALYVPLPTLFL